MSATRPNRSHAPVEMDEQGFQGLLAAAFTIQEHNDRKRPRQEAVREAAEEILPTGGAIEEPARDAAAPVQQREILCPHCGAAKELAESRCASCGKDELRPGEKLQRNWASLWLMSQEQRLFPERFAAHKTDARPAGLPAPYERPKFRVMEAEAQAPASSQIPVAREMPEVDRGRAERSADFSQHDSGELPRADTLTTAPEETGDDEFVAEEFAPAAGVEPRLPAGRFPDLQVTLRFNRANLYLGAAVFITLVALLWPAAAVQKRTGLSPWERAMIKIGIAEAPAPQVRYRGNPDAQVWVDPHTALYYCAGAESFGKTPDGRYASQRDAQVDRFEAAGRSVCE